MGQYYRYYDTNGRSVYTEVHTIAGREQEQHMQYGAVSLDGDTFRAAMVRFDHAEQLKEQEANKVSRIDALPIDPPGGEDPDDGDYDDGDYDDGDYHTLSVASQHQIGVV
jgi:hypothetical protein